MLPRALELSPTFTTLVTAVSAALFVATVLLVPWLLVRLPQDFLVSPRKQHPLLVRVLRNAAGALLVALGILMLALPGQGLLTIVAGVCVLDTPLKCRVVRRLLRHRGIRSAVQALRARAHRPPLVVPDVVRSRPEGAARP